MAIREFEDERSMVQRQRVKNAFKAFCQDHLDSHRALNPALTLEETLCNLNREFCKHYFYDGGAVNRIYLPSKGTKDWQDLLADPVKQWKSGYSAKTLAHSWEDATGFPTEIKQLFLGADPASFSEIEPLLIFPEHKVPLPGGKTQSQNDVFVLARSDSGLVSITIEGKVLEPFGPPLSEWLAKPSMGKTVRLNYLKDCIGLKAELPPNIRYQLLHRTASAMIEARRFNTQKAVMIVHSFSSEHKWLEDFQAFVGLYDREVQTGELIQVGTVEGVDLYLGWATGDLKYLNA